MKIDRNKRLHFASLQSESVQKVIYSHNLDYIPDSLVLMEKGHLYFESEAALRLIKYLPWPFQLLRLFQLLPTKWCNAVYRIISKKRYSWFGERETCRLPTKEEAERFIN